MPATLTSKNGVRVYCMQPALTSDPPWSTVRFVSLSSFVTWKDLQLLPSLTTNSMPNTLPSRSQSEHICHSTEQELRPLLLQKKDRIEAFGNEDEWEHRKKITNPYEYIFGMNDSDLPCILRQTKSFTPLSRSYFKMIEMMHILDFFTILKQKSFMSAHVCEGPGGFIQALLSQSAKHNREVTQALAMTLRPTKPFIPGWRRSISYLREHPEIVLEYGNDNTGDILKLENQRAFISKTLNKCMIFTADGGFDFSSDYSNQESRAFLLILASFRMGLLSLAKGGCMVIKVFDVFLEQTKQLLLGSGLCFECFTLYKPATSRPCNSERYFIGRGFLGATHAEPWVSTVTTAMKRLLTTQKEILATPLFTSPFTQELYSLFESQTQTQIEQQIKAIDNGLHLKLEEKPAWGQIGLAKSREWISVFMPSAAS